jgi:hypothetical protein
MPPTVSHVVDEYNSLTCECGGVELDQPQGSSEAESPPGGGQPFEPDLGNASVGRRFYRPRTVDCGSWLFCFVE